MESLFDSSGFAPRSQCGVWTTWLVRGAVGGNLTVALAYLLFPYVLLALWRRVKAHPARFRRTPKWPFVAWGVFIGSCGVGHIFDVLVFWWPAYRLFTAWTWVIAVSSWVALISTVVILLPAIRALRSPEEIANTEAELKAAGDRLTRILELRDRQNGRLRVELDRLRGLVEVLHHKNAADSALNEIRDVIQNIRGAATDSKT